MTLPLVDSGYRSVAGATTSDVTFSLDATRDAFDIFFTDPAGRKARVISGVMAERYRQRDRDAVMRRIHRARRRRGNS